eukprot:Hpha_TRINITY_DN16843_c1_g3::TRINITY_DN16843_c1_g3_i1::g.152235::m.152235
MGRRDLTGVGSRCSRGVPGTGGGAGFSPPWRGDGGHGEGCTNAEEASRAGVAAANGEGSGLAATAGLATAGLHRGRGTPAEVRMAVGLRLSDESNGVACLSMCNNFLTASLRSRIIAASSAASASLPPALRLRACSPAKSRS